jgi:outer membrane protein assembly factor BamB
MRGAVGALIAMRVGLWPASEARVMAQVPPPPSDWPALYHDAAATNFDANERVLSASNVATLHVAWMAPGNTLIAAPVGLFESINNGPTPQGLYFQVVRTDAATGRSFTRFGYSTEYMGAPTDQEPLAYWPGLLLVSGDRPGLKVISLRSGRPLWRNQDIISSPGQIGRTDTVLTNGVIYAASSIETQAGPQGTVTAINARTGHVAWQHRGRAGGLDVMVAGSRVYSSGSTGTVVYGAVTGKMLYTIPWTGLWTGDAMRSYVLADYEGSRYLWPTRMIAVNGSGKQLWSISVGKVETVRPVLAYDSLFIASNRFHPGVIAVDAATGRIRWAVNFVESPRPLGEALLLAAANHLLFVMHTETGTLDVLDTGTGRQLAHIAIHRYSVNAPYGPGAAQLVVAGGTVYVTGGGRIRALRP